MIAYWETAHNVKVRAIRTDNETALDNAFKDRMALKGISLQFTARYSPESNGLVEVVQAYLNRQAACMIKDSGLPKFL